MCKCGECIWEESVLFIFSHLRDWQSCLWLWNLVFYWLCQSGMPGNIITVWDLKLSHQWLSGILSSLIWCHAVVKTFECVRVTCTLQLQGITGDKLPPQYIVSHPRRHYWYSSLQECVEISCDSMLMIHWASLYSYMQQFVSGALTVKMVSLH